MSLHFKLAPGFGVNGAGDGRSGGIWLWDEGEREPACRRRGPAPMRTRRRWAACSTRARSSPQPTGVFQYPHRVPFWETGPDAVLRYVTCAGGGWGAALERDPELVKRDVRDGYVTVAGAARDYGVVLSGDPELGPRGSEARSRGDEAPARVDAERALSVEVAEQLVAAASALRPVLIERAGETEQRSYYSQETHEDFLAAGFYRMFVPRRYGGLELELGDFLRVVMEIAAGDLSTAWGLCLSLRTCASSRHALRGGGPDRGVRRRRLPLRRRWRRRPGRPSARGEGWEITGTWGYCSGAPYATHYMGQTFEAPPQPGGPPGQMLLFAGPAQRVDDARRLGRHARPARQRLAQHPDGERLRSGAYRARGPVAASTPTRPRARGLPCTAIRSTQGAHSASSRANSARSRRAR